MARISRWLLLTVSVCWPAVGAGADDAVSFRRDVAPILLARCQACHGPRKSESGYRVDTYAHAMAAGDSDAPGFSREGLDESEAFRRITSDDEDERMPAEGDRLPQAQIALVRRWIEQGAKYDGDDANAPLASIVPAPVHPDPPAVYPAALPITALAFREADGAQELFVSGYHEITVWNAENGSLLRRIKNQCRRTYALQLNQAGDLLAAAGGEPGAAGELRLFDPSTGKLIGVPARASDVTLDAAFSPDGKHIAVGTADNRLLVYDVASRRRELQITSHSDWVNAVAYSADGKRIASASRDKTAKVFDAATGEIVVTYNGHDADVLGVAFHPDGKRVYSSDADGKIQLWKIGDGNKTNDVADCSEKVFKLPVVGNRFLVGSADKSARLFEMQSKKQIRAYNGHAEAVLCAAISPDGRRVAAGAFDGVVKVWDAESGEQIASFIAAPGLAANSK